MPRTATPDTRKRTHQPRSPLSLDERVAAAARSDLLFQMRVEDAMRQFGLNHAGLERAKARARDERPEAVADAMRARARDRRFDRLVRIECLHPDIHRRVAAGVESDAEVGRFYSLTRMRVGQIRRDLAEAAVQRHAAVGRLAVEVADAARA